MEVSVIQKSPVLSRVEYNYFFGKHTWNVNLDTVQLTNFSIGGTAISGTTANKQIAGAMIFLDANFNGVWDQNEPFTFSNANGSYKLDIPLQRFDTNQNGKLDDSEGQFVSRGGFDIFTHQKMDTLMAAPAGYAMLTPVTSLVSALIQQGIGPSQAEARVKAALGLPKQVDLATFDPAPEMIKGYARATKVMAAHVAINTVVDQISTMIQGVTPSPTASWVVMEKLSDPIKRGKTLDLSNAKQVETLIRSTVKDFQAEVPSSKWQKILNIADQAAAVMAGGVERMDLILNNQKASKKVLQQVSDVQAVLVGNTADDLKAAVMNKKSIGAVVATNTGKGLDAAIADQNQPAPFRLTQGNQKDDRLQGTQQADVITSRDGNDIVFGNAGNDLIAGGKGDDVLNGGAGNDWLSGDSGQDQLIGGNGNDVLDAGNGEDTLIGGQGKDRFRIDVLDKGVDVIRDFSVQDDVLEVGVPYMTKSVVTPDQLRIGATAVGTSDRFVYNPQTGALFFDADGSGSRPQVHLVQLSPNLALTAQNITLI